MSSRIPRYILNVFSKYVEYPMNMHITPQFSKKYSIMARGFYLQEGETMMWIDYT